jgi:hypothetical protein
MSSIFAPPPAGPWPTDPHVLSAAPLGARQRVSAWFAVVARSSQSTHCSPDGQIPVRDGLECRRMHRTRLPVATTNSNQRVGPLATIESLPNESMADDRRPFPG